MGWSSSRGPLAETKGARLICSRAESLRRALTAQGRGQKVFSVLPITASRRALSRPVYRGGRGTWRRLSLRTEEVEGPGSGVLTVTSEFGVAIQFPLVRKTRD